MTKHLHLKKVLAAVLTIAALATGQQAFATINGPVAFTGYSGTYPNNSTYSLFKIEGLNGISQNTIPGSSFTFSEQQFRCGPYSVGITGTLNFTTGTNYTDIYTGSQVTIVITSSTNYWFYGATVKKLDGTSVSGCSYSIGTNNNSITVTIPSGKTFGYIYLDYVGYEPFYNYNTTIGGVEAEYIYTGRPIEPVPTVIYNGTVLTAGTDYTVSYSNSTGPGSASVTVTGTGQYAGTVTRNYNIRAVALTDFTSLGNNTYAIATTTDLDHLAGYVNLGNDCQGLTFKQTADITYSHGSSTTENNFTQIGGYFGGDKNFRGTYDGQNHTISGIRVYKDPTNNGNAYKNVALFGRISGATIQNVILTDARITGYRYVGGLVGNKASGTVKNCLVVGSTITCGDTYGGALFGSNNGTLTANHYRNCTVNNTTNATNVGVGNGSSSSDMAGARSMHPLTIQNANVTATGESVAYQGTTYYASNTQITLGYNNLPAGYTVTYTLNGTALSGNTFTMPANDNATVNASTALITYNITYDLDGGSVATANPTTYNITTPTFTLNNPTKAGYTFTGWTGSNGTTPQTTVTIAQGSTGNLNYTAHWSLNTYNITYDLDGGSVATANPTTYNVTTPTFTLNNPTKAACTFDGWTGSNGTTPQTTVTIAQGSTGDRDYTAHWTQYAFTLSLGTDITASGTVAFTYEGTDYYAVGTEITLAYGGTIPEGYRPLYSVNGNAIVGDTFEMPAADVVVDAVLLERYYTFNSTTGVLALLWGEFNRYNKWGSEVTESAVTSVTATDEVSFTGDCYQLFYNFTSCTSMDLTDVNTANVTKMSYMFRNCSGLPSLDLSGWNTANVTNMSYMFCRSTSLQSLNLSGWNTANVTNMSNMFRDCSGLQSLNISGWNTANVTDMSNMFYNCESLQSLDLSGWNTANVTDMKYMFFGCSGLQSLDLSGWNTANVTNMGTMFFGCSGLQSLNISGWNTANVSDMSTMFYGCSGLQSLDLTGWSTSNVENMSYMFRGCSGLQSLDLTGWNTANVSDMSNMFYGCSGLQSLDLSGWSTANVTYMNRMFYGCSGLQSLNVSGWNTANVTQMSGMFQQCSSLQSLDLTGWSTSNVEDMSYMFRGCSGLQSLDLTGWSTSNVENMSYMFRGCSGLQSLDLTGWNTANVTNMSGMFYGCSGLTTIYAGEGWNTYNVWDMSDMFDGCTSLVGGMGTTYDAYHTDGEYARIDRGPNSDQPGYFTGRFTKEIAGYEDNESGWYLIASPVGTVNLTDVPHLFDNQYDLYYFDQTGGDNGKEWKNHKAHTNTFTTLESGIGYLYANSGNVTLEFTGAPYSGNGQVTLSYSTASTTSNDMRGWNLIGNPFSTAATLDKPFYRMNESGTALSAQVEAHNSVAAMEGVFVQASTNNETATFTQANNSKGGEKDAVPMLTLNLTRNRGEAIDNTILRFDDGQALGKFTLHKDGSKLYIPQGGKDYAIACAEGQGEMPLNFKASENGTYTLSVNVDNMELDYLHLIDNMTGADVDLLTPEPVEGPATYTFTAKTTDYESRFKLVFSANGNADGDNDAFAFIDASGNIIITGGPSTSSGTCTLQVIDMMGRIVVQGDAMKCKFDGVNRVSTNGMTAGVYVLRLIDGNTIRTQKIVID